MIEALSSSHNRTVTALLLVIAGALAAAAALVGISDNLPGILLLYAAAFALVLAFVHPWRASRKFRYLFYASALGFVVFAVAHNVLEVVAGRMGGPGLVVAALQGIQVAAFLIALLICPAAFIIGLAGGVVMWIRGRRRSLPSQSPGR
ncbi:MAG TPA: hypothetical protein PKJ99_05695 [Thermoanaerobaculales bacterium]|nr:hypothetical protein [Thermoanaerobaculales bacterium]HPA81096.1 hypothetical protein [Thermoanaerobaculales bacterium]HQL28880.1 hypothetical protein [Thermoanaerobaculales bacterium]HQN96371.1 hypothetical protein [Thermoanaerobaculales bacterium]HQP43694.1 hypothetical protein [Thermoanaerobaculales bacterium]